MYSRVYKTISSYLWATPELVRKATPSRSWVRSTREVRGERLSL